MVRVVVCVPQDEGCLSVAALDLHVRDPSVVAVYTQTLSYTDGISDDLPAILQVKRPLAKNFVGCSGDERTSPHSPRTLPSRQPRTTKQTNHNQTNHRPRHTTRPPPKKIK
jgi:hypothetical protein